MKPKNALGVSAFFLPLLLLVPETAFPVDITFRTLPEGLPFYVDGTAYTADSTLSLTQDSTFTVKVDSLVTGGSLQVGERYRFVEWVDIASTDTSRSFTVPAAPYTLTARFEHEYFLSVSVEPSSPYMGTVAAPNGPPGRWYVSGQTAYPTYQTETGYFFLYWKGDHEGRKYPPPEILMDGPKQITAVFGKRINVTIQSTPAWRAIPFYVTSLRSREDQTGTYTSETFNWYSGEEYRLSTDSLHTVSQNTRLSFARWNSVDVPDSVRTDRTIEFTVPYYAEDNPSTSIFCEFEEQNKADVWAAYGTPYGEGYYTTGDSLTFGVTPDTVFVGHSVRHSFEEWFGYGEGSYSGHGNPRTILMPSNYIAEDGRFKTEYRIRVLSDHGTAYGDGWAEADSNLTFGVTAREDILAPDTTRWAFQRWTGVGNGSYTGTATSYTLTVNDSITETATWQYQHKLTLHSDWGRTAGEGWKQAGSVVVGSMRDSLVALTDGSRMVFDRWVYRAAGSPPDSVARLAFTIPTMDTSYTATARWHREHLLDFTPDPGTVTLNDPNGDGWYADGASAVACLDSTMFMDGAGTRQVFDSLMVSIAGVVADSVIADSCITVTMDTSVVCDAYWHTEYSLIVTEEADVDGDVARDPAAMDGVWHYADSTVELTATPVGGNDFIRWNGDLSGTTNPNSILMDGPKEVTAFFGDSTYVTVQTNPGGLDFRVDLTEYTSAQTFGWLANQLHELSTDSIQNVGGNTRYTLILWDVTGDTTDASIDYLVPGSDDTVTAEFQQQFLLSVDEGGHSSATGAGWKNEGASAQVCIADSIVMDGAGTRYVFDAWHIDFDGGSTVIDSTVCTTISMDTAATATAHWHREHYLDVSADPGTATLSDTSGWYPDGAGALVTLDNSVVSQGVETRSVFDEWEIQATGGSAYTLSDTSFSVTMDTSFTAFARWNTEYVLGVRALPDTAGTVTRSHVPSATLAAQSGYDRFWYPESLSVSLTALPDADHYFIGWQDSLSGTDNPKPILMDEPKRVTAAFGLKVVVVVGTVPDSLDFVVDGGNYDAETSFLWQPSTYHTLNTDTVQQASPDEKYRFTHWRRFSDDWTNAFPMIAQTPSVSDTLFAYFYKKFKVTVDPGPGEFTGGGWVWKDSTARVCVVDSNFYIGDTARYAFYGWEIAEAGAVVDTLPNACSSIVIDTVTTATALWRREYLLDVTDGPGVATGGGWYTAGDTADVILQSTVVDNGQGKRHVFDGWTGTYPGSYTGTDSTFRVVMDGYIKQTADWHVEYRLSAEAIPYYAGEVISDPAPQDTAGSGFGYWHLWYLESDTVSLDAFAYGFYTFNEWTGDLSGWANPDTLVMDGPKSVTADFGDRVDVIIGTDPDSLIYYTEGTPRTGTNSFRWIADEVYAVSTDSLQDVVPGMRYRFTDWNGIAFTDSIAFRTSVDTTLTARFQKEFFLTVDAGFGEIDAEGWYPAGTDTTLCIAEDTVTDGMTRYILDGWIVALDGGVPDTVQTECFTLTLDTSAAATSLWHTEYELVVNADSSTATGAGWYTGGDSATVVLDSATVSGGPATRYLFDDWTVAWPGGGSYTEPDSSFAVKMDSSLTATARWHTEFILRQRVSPDSGGSIARGFPEQEIIVPDSAYWYVSGDTIPVTALPNAGYVFAYWEEDLAGDANPDTLRMTGPKSIGAVFGAEVLVTVNTDPDSLMYTADGVSYVDSTTFTWLADTTYSLAVDSIQAAAEGVRYVFQSWNQVLLDTAFSFSTAEDTAFTAYFDEEMRLTVMPDHGTADEPGGWYATGTSRAVCIDDTLVYDGEAHRYWFDGWLVTRPDTSFTVADSCYTAFLDTPVTATAQWREQYYLSTDVDPDGWGEIVPEAPGGWYDTGDTVVICASPAEGRYFTGWSILPPMTPHPTDTCFTMVVDTSTIVLAHFNPQYDIVVGTRPGGLSYWVDSTANAFTQTSERIWRLGEVHTLGTVSTQVRGTGSRYSFTGWSDGAPTLVRSYTVVKDDSVFALFHTDFLLNVEAGPGTAAGAGWYDRDETAVLCLDSTVVGVSPNSHRVFDDWLVERSGQNAYRVPDSCTTLVMDTTVTATAAWFGLVTRVEPAGAGRVEVRSVEDDFVRVRAVPTAGFTFDHWEEAHTGGTAQTGFVIQGDTSLTAVFDTLDILPPRLVDVAPPPEALNVPRNVNVGFRLTDDLYGVNLQSLDVYMSGTAIVLDGVDQTEGRVTIDSDDFVVVYSPAAPFAPAYETEMRVVCGDRAHIPNVLDTTYAFTTGQGIITNSSSFFVAPQGSVWEDTTGITFTFPPNSIPDSLAFTLGWVNNPPALPDSLSWSGPVYYLGPDGFTFGFPVTVTLLIPASMFHEWGAGSVEGLVLVFYNSIAGTWTIVDISGSLGGGGPAGEGAAGASLSVQVLDANSLEVTFTLPGTGFFALASAPIPDELEIYNYPNPFNPEGNPSTTNIIYRVAEETRVTVSIYDVSGRLVREWDDGGLKDPNTVHRIVWDGRNGQGDLVANNVYFCIIETEQKKKLIRKIAVLR